MQNQAGFIAKVLIVSLVISVLIKYGASYLNLPATDTVALVAVFLPPVALGIALLVRSRRSQQQRQQN
jgi:ABC-type molybdate transport system permease subunit